MINRRHVKRFKREICDLIVLIGASLDENLSVKMQLHDKKAQMSCFCSSICPVMLNANIQIRFMEINGSTLVWYVKQSHGDCCLRHQDLCPVNPTVESKQIEV